MQRVRNAVKFGFLLVLPLLFLVACMDDSPTEFSGDPPRAATIQDALNGENGNPFVFLKPPVVEQPSSDEFGTFNPALQPVVEVCHLDVPDPGECEVLLTNDGSNELARYTVDGGPGGETVTLDAAAEEYQVQIHFALFDLFEGETYRIVTRVGAKQLAFADVVVVSPQEMRNQDTGSDIVFTNDQKTVPWKVRIDEGALCWDPGETVISCTSSTVDSGEEETVTLTSSNGEDVELFLPTGWAASVDGEAQDELTISIEEVPAADGDDPTCFAFFTLDDPETGEPANCYLVRADTDTDTDVTVDFSGSLPILAFCPDSQVLQAIANGVEGWIMTSVEEDDAGAATRTYANVHPASEGFECPLPDPTVVGFGDGIAGSLASALWTHVRPVMTPLLPQPLHAVDIGFGGSLDQLGTIFFWSRTPTDLVVGPASPSVAVGQTVQLTVDPVFHEDATLGGTFDVTWSSSDANVASVDATTGLVTGVSANTAEITATAVNISDPSGDPVTGSTTVTVNAQAGAPASFECLPDPAGGGDQISRGFYIPSYEGFEISQIDLFFNADVAGEYTFSLTMRDGAFDGTVLGTAQATVTLDGTRSQVGTASFVFTGATGLTGKTLAFAIDQVSGPATTVFYNVGGFPLDPTAATSCPVVETEDTSPPLSTDRRNGIGITVVGGAAVTIDGVLSAGEWDDATTVNFDANVPDGSGGTTTTPATLFILNDNTNLYLAVQFARSVVDDGTNLLNFEFDHDNDGVGPEDGDDHITFSLSTGQLSDAHRSSGGSAVTTDGIRHGEGAFHNDETHSVYEISHPLKSGETGQDLALTPPSTVGMMMQLQIGSVSTRKPDGTFPTYMPITID